MIQQDLEQFSAICSAMPTLRKGLFAGERDRGSDFNLLVRPPRSRHHRRPDRDQRGPCHPAELAKLGGEGAGVW